MTTPQSLQLLLSTKLILVLAANRFLGLLRLVLLLLADHLGEGHFVPLLVALLREEPLDGRRFFRLPLLLLLFLLFLL